jgi:hypothetical protein
MSAGEPGGFGTVYHPEPDMMPNGGTPAVTMGQLRSLPRRRRPGMIALAVVLVGAGILASAALYQRQNHSVAVILVTSRVQAGAVITAADLTTTSIVAGSGIKVIPARQLAQVTGLVAATSLRPGTLLAPSELTTSLPPAAGQVLVPLGFKPAALPATGLTPGDQVLVIATPAIPGTGSGATSFVPVMTKPVAGVVEAVTAAPDQDGFEVVDLLIPSGSAAELVEQASTSQVGLYVTKRVGG